ncbi:hypothetical protein LSTR_LSTR003932 [Laodelphax striatellus]|uniref:Phosphatidylcholine transfer protein n=1 Tax=Laodelphax striatellus TaxID=195883 RepID=A0A482X931_LAOST|nr:hypothetical protein LSTR_LSTR003932 [Laodelphax striatellus]
MRLFSIPRLLFSNTWFGSSTQHSTGISENVVRNTFNMFSTNFKRALCQNKIRYASTIPNRRKLNNIYSNIFVYLCNTAMRNMPLVLRNQSVNLLRSCAEQCEFILAQRVRRSQQIFCLYMKIWDDVALKHFLECMRRNFLRKGKHLLLGLVIYNWDEERIKEEDIVKYSNELELIRELLRKKFCRKQELGDRCDCFNCLEPEEQEWSAFVKETDLVVWKKEDSNHKGEGLYCYKVYGKYEDVTALNFLEAQVDLDYRLEWDENAVKLHTIESEPQSNSDVIYWATKWPKMFSNRDYVFKRRYHIDHRKNLIILVNRSTKHHTVPPYNNKQRVTEYWSYMVIKPFTQLDKPGLEFSLTYFDNPGISVPSSITLWVTVQGMPTFLRHLHTAAKTIGEKRAKEIDEKKERGDGRRPPGGTDRKTLSPFSMPAKRDGKADESCPQLPKSYLRRFVDFLA